MKARAVNPRKPHEMTKAEFEFLGWEWFVDNFAFRRYEALTFKMGEHRYTPDFSGIDVTNQQVCLFEVKASGGRHAFTDAAKIKIQAAAEAFPEYRFYVVWPIKPKGSWHIEEVSNKTRNVGEF
jgi:hypothetical protein